MSFVHYSLIQLGYFWWSGETTSWINLVSSMVCWEQFVRWWGSYIATFIMTTLDYRPAECRYTFSDDTCSSTTVLILFHMEHQSLFPFEHFFFTFSSDFLTYQPDFCLFWHLNILSSTSSQELPLTTGFLNYGIHAVITRKYEKPLQEFPHLP